MVFGVMPIPKERLPSALRSFQSIINFIHITIMIILMATYQSGPFGYMFFGATNFYEYTQGVFFIAVTTLHISVFICLLFQRTDLVALMDDLEEMIERSEF